MEEIIFIGNASNGYFAKEVAEAKGLKYTHIDISGYIIKNTAKILLETSGKDIQTIIFDIDCFIDEAEILAKEIRNIANALNFMPIAYMPGYSPKSEIGKALINNNIKNFIIAGGVSDLKEQLIKILTGYFENNGRKEIDEVEEEIEADKAKRDVKTVGIAGMQNRVGTTTIAIQLVKYLILKGYNACYVEMNNHTYKSLVGINKINRDLTYVEKFLSLSEKSEEPFIQESVPMFLGMDKLSKVDNVYDYIIFDYGSIREHSFDKNAFMKDDKQIIVAGAKIQEIDYLKIFLENTKYTKADLIMTFTDMEIQSNAISFLNMIKEKLELRYLNIFFSPPILNEFKLQELEFFERLFPLEIKKSEITEEAAPKKKHKLFRKKNKVRRGEI